ncbi:hypothetical protein RB195_023295 [Necator americanus]|uniref:MULE transposase domain-containing protein n=1 Tax=Necator americanus TaxID=51031 RepID=A0ABR1EIJ9_NECAM
MRPPLILRVTATKVQVLFELVKEYFQELNPQYVMTDDTYVFYNTFKAVFPASRAAKVFCSCHISQALQRKHKELLKCVRGGSDMSWRRKRNVQRHKEALMRYKDAPAAITKATENLWKVVSSCRNGVAYEVTINDSPCDCSEEINSHCERCGVFAYQAQCSCPDGYQSGVSHCHSVSVAVCSDPCGIAWMPVKLRRQKRAVALL